MGLLFLIRNLSAVTVVVGLILAISYTVTGVIIVLASAVVCVILGAIIKHYDLEIL